MVIVEGNALVDLVKNINEWLGNGKTIKSIEIYVDEKKFYSHKAEIKIVKTRGK